MLQNSFHEVTVLEVREGVFVFLNVGKKALEDAQDEARGVVDALSGKSELEMECGTGMDRDEGKGGGLAVDGVGNHPNHKLIIIERDLVGRFDHMKKPGESRSR